MKQRIRDARKALNLTQQAFAAKIGFSQNYIWQIEKGERTPSDRTIADICREFGINEDWLRTGEGEMMKPISREEEISEFLGSVIESDGSDFRRRLVSVLAKLDTSEWELLERMALKLAAETKKEDQAEA